MEHGLARFAPLTGVAAVLAWIAGVIVSESDAPGDDAPGAELVAYFSDEDWSILGGGGLFALGSALFIWFLASLVGRLRAAGDDGRLGSIAFAGGVAMAVTAACITVPVVAAALAVENRDATFSPEVAEALWVLGDGFIVVAMLMAFTFMAATALAILRTKAFSLWFGWLTALMALTLLILPVGWAVLIWGIPLWTLIVSIWIFVAQGRPAAETA
jgi:hypothetical protein